MRERLTVLGGGAFGSALATVASRDRSDVLVWEPLLTLPPKRSHIRYTEDLHEALSWSPTVVLAVATQAIRSVIEKISRATPLRLAIASKGIEKASGLLISEVIASAHGDSVVLAAMGGPNLASELLSGTFTTGITIASQNEEFLEDLCTHFGKGLLIQRSCDIIGVQLAGALKNVMAIGYGFLQQANVGENALSTFLTKAFEEILVFARALGAEDATFLGFSGIGDFILSCTSPRARNARFGREFPDNTDGLAEGHATTFAALSRAHETRIQLPIISGIGAVLSGKCSVSSWPTYIQSCK